MPVQLTVVHTLGQQLTVQVEGGQDKKSRVIPGGVAFEREESGASLGEKQGPGVGGNRAGDGLLKRYAE